MKTFKPVIVAFLCENSAYRVLDIAGVRKISYPLNIRVVKVPCSGRVGFPQILQAFSSGADGVLIFGCLEGGCYYVNGNLRALTKVKQLKGILDTIGLGSERLDIYLTGFCEINKIIDYMGNFYEKIMKLGPNPLKRREGV